MTKRTISLPLPKRVRKEHLEALMLGVTLYGQYKNIKDRVDVWRYNRGYTVTVTSTDQAYDVVVRSLLELLDQPEQHAVSVVSRRQNDGSLAVLEGWNSVRTQTITIDGHEIDVTIQRPEAAPGAPGGQEVAETLSVLLASSRPDQLLFWSKSYAGKNAVVRFIDRAVAEDEHTAPKLWTVRWGSWYDQSDVPARSLDTVVLAKGLAEDIRSDIEAFLSQEHDYAEAGLPWHRGYLLHGCPGSGKTSLVKALASELDLDLYAVSLSTVQNDNALMNLMSSVEARSALLLEDVDSTSAARDRDKRGDPDDDNKGITSSGLLNALDGIGTPHGLILFMSTNRLSTLDPALIRPGRCDRIFEIGYLDDEQLSRMVQQFAGITVDLPPVPPDLAPAAVIELYKENIGTPENFVPALVKMLNTVPA